MLVVLALLARTWCAAPSAASGWRSATWTWLPAAVIGIRPMYAKLSAFAVSSFIIGVAGALWGFIYLGAWEPPAFSVD